jgi:hypothetical protein
MFIAIIVIAVVVVAVVIGLLALRSRSARDPLTPDPRTHARDNTDPATAIDQQRSQGNAGGIGGAF